MAVIFAEQSETGSLGGWIITSEYMALRTSPTAGPWSTYSLEGVNGGFSHFDALWDAAVGTFYGQARINPFDGVGAGRYTLKFVSPNNVVNFTIRMDSDLKMKVYWGDTATFLGSGSLVHEQGQWYYYQFYAKIHDTTGEVTVKIDGTTDLTLTGQDTRADAGAGGDTCDRIHVYGQSVFDDVIINDTTDTDNVSYPDNLGIEALMPSAAGDNTGLSRGGTDSGANWSQVEERPPNDATDYVFDSVVNDYDLYNLPSTQWTSVAAVVLPIRAQKSDAGAASIAHMVKVDTDASGTADTENQGADIAMSNSWIYHTKYYNRQPGPTSWTPAKVNALQAGVKVR
jgi:hypothetical protein